MKLPVRILPLAAALLVFLASSPLQGWGQPTPSEREKQLDDARDKILYLEKKIRGLEINALEDRYLIELLEKEVHRLKQELYHFQEENQSRGNAPMPSPSEEMMQLMLKCKALEGELEIANKKIKQLEEILRLHPQ